MKINIKIKEGLSKNEFIFNNYDDILEFVNQKITYLVNHDISTVTFTFEAFSKNDETVMVKLQDDLTNHYGYSVYMSLQDKILSIKW